VKALSIKEIGERLVQAGKLETRPLCVYGADTVPLDGIPISELDRCAARAIFAISNIKDSPSIYIGEGFEEGCCPGGLTYFGYMERHPMLKFFLSSGNKDFRGGAAEFLRITPELAEESFQASGKINKLGRFLVISPSEDIKEDPGVRSFLVFGSSESIRNLCGLVYFMSGDIFTSVLVPGGASCASFVTFGAGMAERSPKDAAFVGPVDPTGNQWFPKDNLSMAIPIQMAMSMALDLEDSFLTKREGIAYPKKRIAP
jgi:hypothetical protein